LGLQISDAQGNFAKRLRMANSGLPHHDKDVDYNQLNEMRAEALMPRVCEGEIRRGTPPKLQVKGHLRVAVR
jgi:hypothetical protein